MKINIIKYIIKYLRRDKMLICKNCGKEINDGYSICDSCGVDICIDCHEDWNECPVCGEEITFKENF
jgi:RNA polymerase subunit RPABC4/transcription elongation factor Spt4